MTLRPRDPLLTTARLVITLSLWLVALIAVSLVLAVPSLVVFRPEVLAKIAEHGGRRVDTETIAAICGAIAILALMFALACKFLLELRRIIDSVALGDSFAAVNAERLAQMGWLTVAVQVLSIPLGFVTHWLDPALLGGHAELGPVSPGGGILMALLLFVLARVFREGTRMRDELEGTV